ARGDLAFHLVDRCVPVRVMRAVCDERPDAIRGGLDVGGHLVELHLFPSSLTSIGNVLATVNQTLPLRQIWPRIRSRLSATRTGVRSSSCSARGPAPSNRLLTSCPSAGPRFH